MNRPLRAFVLWWDRRKLNRDLRVVSRRIREVEARAEAREARFEAIRRRLESILDELALDMRLEEETRKGIREQIGSVEIRNQRLDDEVNRLREELEVAKLSVKQMAAANQLALERYEADTAVQIRRQVANEVGQ